MSLILLRLPSIFPLTLLSKLLLLDIKCFVCLNDSFKCLLELLLSIRFCLLEILDLFGLHSGLDLKRIVFCLQTQKFRIKDFKLSLSVFNHCLYLVDLIFLCFDRLTILLIEFLLFNYFLCLLLLRLHLLFKALNKVLKLSLYLLHITDCLVSFLKQFIYLACLSFFYFIYLLHLIFQLAYLSITHHDAGLQHWNLLILGLQFVFILLNLKVQIGHILCH